MAHPKKIGLFFPAANELYSHHLKALVRCFESRGVEVCAGLTHPDEAQMAAIVSQFKPEVVFEINRSRAQAPFVPDSIRHVCWVQDHIEGQSHAVFQGSDIIYVLLAQWQELIDSPHSKVRWLMPGVCEKTYLPRTTERFISDGGFAGYLRPPYREGLLQKKVVHYGGVDLMFGKFVKEYEKIAACFPVEYTIDDILDEASTLIRRLVGAPDNMNIDLGRVFSEILTGISLRSARRTRFINQILEVTSSMRIAGNRDWSLWPEYASHYIGHLTEPQELNRFYQGNRFNLHEGIFNLHFRTFECMASGAVMCVRKLPTDEQAGGIQTVFEPEKHYLHFDEGDFESVYQRCRNNDAELLKLGQDASTFVHRHHTWQHRVDSILGDLRQI